LAGEVPFIGGVLPEGLPPQPAIAPKKDANARRNIAQRMSQSGDLLSRRTSALHFIVRTNPKYSGTVSPSG
jgi:hypothetical protein